MEANVKILPAVSKILAALATGGYDATCHVIEHVLTPVIQQFHKHTAVSCSVFIALLSTCVLPLLNTSFS